MSGVLSLTPIRPDLGARVRGLDLAAGLAPGQAEALEAALHRHGMLVVEGQHDLPPQALMAFAANFCEPREPVESVFRVDGAPHIAVLGNVVAEGKPLGFQNKFGIEWHVDGTGWQRAAATTFLYCLETPAASGDTLFLHGAAALESLPAMMRDRVLATRAIYNRQQLINLLRKASDSDSDKEMTDEEARAFPDVIRPLVRRHPVTGQLALGFTIEEIRLVEGMTRDEGRAFLEDVLAQITAGPLVYSHRWARGELVMWDNRLVMHSTTPYTYAAEKRLHWRLIGYEKAGELAPLAPPLAATA